jgi:transcriptional regulator with XRE-family HTH domain
MENKINYFGKNIKWWRKSERLSQTSFAKIIGKKTSVVSAYENGISIPSLGVITRISNILELSVDELMYQDLSKLDNDKLSSKNESENNSEISNLKSNLNKQKNTFSTEFHDETLTQDDIIHILFVQERIRETKDLIKVLAANYKFNLDENILFRCYLRSKKYITVNDLDSDILNEKDFYKLNEYIDKINKLLTAIYEDLFNITYLYNIIMAK